MKNLLKCNILGYAFLAVVTLIEGILLACVVGATYQTLPFYFIFGATVLVFNASIWFFAMKYLKTQQQIH